MSPTHSCVPWVPLCALVAYWGGDARGQHGTVTPGQCLYTLLGWKAMSGSPRFALLCSASACNSKFETIPAVSCSLQIMYAMEMVTASTVLLPAPFWFYPHGCPLPQREKRWFLSFQNIMKFCQHLLQIIARIFVPKSIISRFSSLKHVLLWKSVFWEE